MNPFSVVCAYYATCSVIVLSSVWASVKTDNYHFLWLLALMFLIVPGGKK